MNHSEQPRKKQVSKLATAGFIALAMLLLYGALRFSGKIVSQELLRTPEPDDDSQVQIDNPNATPAPSPDQTADAVFSLRTPEPEDPSASVSSAPGDQTPSPTTAPPPAASTPYPARFDEQEMDLAIIGFDSSGYADMISILIVRQAESYLLSLPKNTLSVDGTPLSSANSELVVLQQLSELLGISLPYYLCFGEAAIPGCVEAIGGVIVDGSNRSGADAANYLSASGLDEILRSARQQVFLQSFAKRVQGLSLIKLWSAKRTLQGNADSNLNGEQGWILYYKLKSLDLDAMQLKLLPVDSTVQNGGRYYRIDKEILEKFIANLYKNR